MKNGMLPTDFQIAIRVLAAEVGQIKWRLRGVTVNDPRLDYLRNIQCTYDMAIQELRSKGRGDPIYILELLRTGMEDHARACKNDKICNIFWDYCDGLDNAIGLVSVAFQGWREDK